MEFFTDVFLLSLCWFQQNMVWNTCEFSPGINVINPLGGCTFNIHVVSCVDDNSLLRTIPHGQDICNMFEKVSQEVTSWRKILHIV